MKLEKHKKYIVQNKDSIYAYSNDKFSCSCGGSYTRHNKSTHEKSKLHINYIQQNSQQNI